MDSGTPISIESARPLRAFVAASSPTAVAGRWLLLPIELDTSKKGGWDGFSSGGYSFSGSAWIGLLKGGYGGQRLNLDVVDLKAGRHDLVFDRQVALGTWELSFNP